MATDLLSFPVSSVFIGANFGLAALAHAQQVSGTFLYLWKNLLIMSTIGSAALSIISSSWILDNLSLATSSVYLLAFSYFMMVFIGTIYIVIGKYGRNKETENIMSDHKKSEKK